MHPGHGDTQVRNMNGDTWGGWGRGGHGDTRDTQDAGTHGAWTDTEPPGTHGHLHEHEWGHTRTQGTQQAQGHTRHDDRRDRVGTGVQQVWGHLGTHMPFRHRGHSQLQGRAKRSATLVPCMSPCWAGVSPGVLWLRQRVQGAGLLFHSPQFHQGALSTDRGGSGATRGPRRGGHGGGATPRTPWCPSVLSTAQHPGPDPAGQRRQPGHPRGGNGTSPGGHRGDPQGGL